MSADASMGTDTGVLGRPGDALEVGDLRFLEDGGERGGALGFNVVPTETASEGRRVRGERVSISTGADRKTSTIGAAAHSSEVTALPLSPSQSAVMPSAV